MTKHSIHIVSFDVPYPANYGGVIDIYYKVKALHLAGYDVTLHCFQYGREEAPELLEYCTRVYYYKRKKGIRYILSKLPYIVITRKNQALLQRLNLDDSPILFEGLHCAAYLDHPTLENRQKYVRTHNIEHEYYAGLSKASGNPFRKLYYTGERIKLKAFEKILRKSTALFAISDQDQSYFSKKFNRAAKITAFHPYSGIQIEEGKGDYFLYHGNLSVEENIQAIRFLAEEVLPQTDLPFIVAGKSPGPNVRRILARNKNIKLIADPSEEEMNTLISQAHCHVLPTFQATGIKLKLLNALFQGRFVLTNHYMTQGSGLEDLCEMAETAADFSLKMKQISRQRFNASDLDQRKERLITFTPEYGVRKIKEVMES